MSSSECRRREVTARMWCAAEDCSRSERRQLEKLGRRRLRVEYEEQTACEMKWNADAFETPTLLDDEVYQRDMTVSGREDIYKQERPAWSLSAKRLSASVVGVGAAWSDHKSRMEGRSMLIIGSKETLDTDDLWKVKCQGNEVTSQNSFSFEARPIADGATWQRTLQLLVLSKITCIFPPNSKIYKWDVKPYYTIPRFTIFSK